MIVFGFSVFGQSARNQPSSGWESVTVTRNSDDVKGLKKICDINVSAKRMFGGQAKLRKEAIEKAKEKAFEKGAQIVLIEEDNFEATPINNVNIVGEAYAESSISSRPSIEVNNMANNTQSISIDTLKNTDIVEMTRKKVPDEIIILKIKHSTCNFNTSADGLAELVKSGVREKVIEAMIQ